MSALTATAIAHPNIAFIKYWGNRDENLRIPANGSISMNLDGLFTRTSVTFSPNLKTDLLFINGKPAEQVALRRVSRFLDHIRGLAKTDWYTEVVSENNFPTGAGLASSAAAFAALSMAATAALGLKLTEQELSRIARLGSGSACRSVPGGFVEWQAGTCHEDSFAFSIAPPAHWNLVDCIAIASSGHKSTGSTEGHSLAFTSPLQLARVADTPRRLDKARRAILERDFATFAEIVEQDSTLMHAVMMTSTPPLFYWQPVSLEIMQKVSQWRAEGIPCCFTLDAGPNVHVITLSSSAPEITSRLSVIPGIQQVLQATPGGPTQLIEQ
ncbi:diphosphomevalonate decarboxylase [Anaerolinea thermolimosa]|uniref:diphosphomevalonate decarboxylase n=1 Tax=Anaerolinea thermolimosa TaxID=229919 RepID=UPI000781058F|nr:diphosphomevalonate decarboxylase [Anaerolinea thermolimosa]GAP06686.1 diphosphomevalonate decarboxylase [Anaerolinea thermolimosa]